MRATQNIPGYRKAKGDEIRCQMCRHGLPESRSKHFRLYCSFHDGHMSVAATNTCDYINHGRKTAKQGKAKDTRKKS